MTKGNPLYIVCILAHISLASSSNIDVEILRKLTDLESAVHKLESENLKVTSENKELQAKIDKQNAKLEEALGSSTKTMGRRLTLASVTADLATVTAAMDTMWLLVCGFLIMLMQAGFAMVESGTCRTINVSNILLKNMVDVCVGTLCWFAFGYSFAYGFDSTKADTDVFAGNMNYFGHEFLESNENGDQVATNHPRDWFFQWTFCATGATIVSGGVAERVQFPGYLIFTICMTTYIYPIVVAWMWSTNGWLTAGGKNHLNEVGFNDFAGSGIVHMTGGVAALVGACAVGPRNGRFNESGVDQDAFSPHNLPFLVLGTFILWFGWYGFNCGSTLGVSGGLDKLAAVVAMNTTISASVGGLGVLVLRLAVTKKFDVGGMCNGVLAGLVSITAGCGNVECGSAFVIGLIGALVYEGTSKLLLKLQVDDPIDAFAVHGAAGAWGVLAAALFDWGKGFDRYNGFGGGFSNAADLSDNKDNLWISGFAAAIVEILAIIGWVGGMSAIIFVPLRLAGLLRADDDMQAKGMDAAKHSPPKAYTESVGTKETIPVSGILKVVP